MYGDRVGRVREVQAGAGHRSQNGAVRSWMLRGARPHACGMPCRLDASRLSWLGQCEAPSAIEWRNEALLAVRSVQDAPRSFRGQEAYGDVLFQLGERKLDQAPTRRPSRSPSREALGAFAIHWRAAFATLATGGPSWISSSRGSRNSPPGAMFRGMSWPKALALGDYQAAARDAAAARNRGRTRECSMIFEGWRSAQTMFRRRRARSRSEPTRRRRDRTASSGPGAKIGPRIALYKFGQPAQGAVASGRGRVFSAQ